MVAVALSMVLPNAATLLCQWVTMPIVAALIAAAVVLQIAFNWSFQAVLGPGVEQAAANAEAFGEMSRREVPLELRQRRSDAALRAAPRATPRDWKPSQEETRPGGWGVETGR